MKKKYIFLDRDGIINQCAAPHEYIASWKEFEFLPGVFNTLRKFSGLNYGIIIVTNQRGIARGKITKKDVEEIHIKMLDSFKKGNIKIKKVYYCPHDNGECNCRKPLPGMIEQAVKEFDVDVKKSWMIGDSKSDIELGSNTGLRTIYLGEEESIKKMADYSAQDLPSAARFLE